MSRAAESRVDRIVTLVTQLAAGDLSARQEPAGVDDELDAITVGVNMLGEELEASHAELEERVRARTAEIEELNHEIMQLTELGTLLQACATRAEAYSVLQRGVNVLFKGLSGVVYLFNASRNALEQAVAWGDAPGPEVLTREDCWAMRRGEPHIVRESALGLPCAHVRPGTGDSLCIPMAANGETIGLLHLFSHSTDSEQTPITDARQHLGNAVAVQIALSVTNLELRETLRQQALRDSMTGLFNRRFLDEWIDREVNRADHAGTSLGVIMADIDHFKQVNDIHGHEAGDRVLTAVASAIGKSVRAGDLPCRYGGEEFLILITDIELDDLIARAERMRVDVAELSVEHGGTLLPAITISLGVALYPQHGGSAPDVVKAADAALYAAKNAGRNRVTAAPGQMSASPRGS
ncbi:MAG: hypothetical protein QOG63_1300 [Thermoleophilaceae bacterium]|jgi:diguanylate cyclase (GGDEF)-like protein|nr:hypothetical protein [Thermoleophilaceae bacterium]